jgi:hypothetical protein
MLIGSLYTWFVYPFFELLIGMMSLLFGIIINWNIHHELGTKKQSKPSNSASPSTKSASTPSSREKPLLKMRKTPVASDTAGAIEASEDVKEKESNSIMEGSSGSNQSDSQSSV